MKPLGLSTGDTVIALGSTVSKDGVVEKHKELCTVIATGKYDIFAKTESGRVFKIPAERCVKIEDVDRDLSTSALLPKMGDLVLSIYERFGKIEKKVGVLVEITDIPGKIKMATLLKGEKKEIASYESLIVLE